MLSDPFYNRFRENAWRRPLNAEEEQELNAWLAAHPDVQLDWEAESSLNQHLEKLPDAPPVSSNFTARVLAAVDRENAAEARASRASSVWQRWQRWLPRIAMAGGIACVGLLSLHHLQESRRLELVGSVSAISKVSSLPSPAILRDFDTIRALSSTPPPDEQLLSLLQ